MKDPFIAEIRKIRAKLDRMIKRDPEQYRARLKAIEEQYKDSLVRLKPRRLAKSDA